MISRKALKRDQLGERGQALAETAIFTVLCAIIAFGILTLIPIHRTKTAAIAAAYGCAQFLAEAPDPAKAIRQAYLMANATLDADWSATMGSQFTVDVNPPGAPGQAGTCTVKWVAPVMFGGLLGLSGGLGDTVTFTSRSEAWKADW